MNTYYTTVEYETASKQNLAEYLLAMGYELKREGHGYRGVLHDSFVIPDANKNEWHWNSKDLHGKEPINGLRSILQYDYGYEYKDAYMTAIKKLVGTEGTWSTPKNVSIRSPKKEEQTAKEQPFLLPEKNNDMKRAYAYLCQTRKIDPAIVTILAKENKIFETKEWHNVCFVSYDKDQQPRHAFMRGTTSNSNFKKDVPNSDKTYGFTLMGNPEATKLHCFESSIDLLSHASLFKLHGIDYKDVHRIGLHGTSFFGLDHFLKEHPLVNTIVSCLDDDVTGNLRSEKLVTAYEKQGYKVARQAPHGKDFNEMLIHVVSNMTANPKGNFYKEGSEYS